MWFEDEDVDFDDKNIIISRRGINNGDIINITSNELIFEFTQNDILKKEIAFRHRGLSYDQFVFWAKDGAHSTASMMRVQAGPPLITIDVTPELSIQKDSEAEITLKNFGDRNGEKTELSMPSPSQPFSISTFILVNFLPKLG